MHILVLHRKFDLIPIKIGFFYEFLKLLKFGQNTLYYSTWLGQILSKMARREFTTFIFFDTYTYFCFKFELIPIKI